jgi:hypothetical protein
MMKALKIVGWVILGVLGVGALVLGLGLVVMALWNWLIPAIFGLPALGYWQALGLLVLCHLLFKGPSGYRHGPRRDRDYHGRTFARKVRASVCCPTVEGDGSLGDEAGR